MPVRSLFQTRNIKLCLCFFLITWLLTCGYWSYYILYNNEPEPVIFQPPFDFSQATCHILFLSSALQEYIYLDSSVIDLLSKAIEFNSKLYFSISPQVDDLLLKDKFRLIVRTSVNSFDASILDLRLKHKLEDCTVICIDGSPACPSAERFADSQSVEFHAYHPRLQDETQAACKEFYIVLGNMPLAPDVVSMDTLARIKAATVEVSGNLERCMILSGGPTASVFPGTKEEKENRLTEAEMMAIAAVMRGVQPSQILLEQKSTSTGQNAIFSEKLLLQKYTKDEVKNMRVVIVSKSEHLDWAVPIFKKIESIKHIDSLAATITKEEIISQMENYVRIHPSEKNCNEWFCVNKRLENVRNGIKGID